MKLIDLSFFVMKKEQYDFLKERHVVDRLVYKPLEAIIEIKYFKLHERRFVPHENFKDEVFFPATNGFFHVPFSMLKGIWKEKPQVLVVHGLIHPFQFILMKLFVGSRCRIIVRHHAEKPFINRVKALLQRFAYRKASAYLFTSMEQARPFLSKGIIKNRDRVKEVMEGSSVFKPGNKSEARKKLGLDGTTIFLWVGRLDSNKDPLTVLKAFSRWKAASGKFRLYMIYATNELLPDVSDFIASHNLTSEVTLVGKLPYTAMQDWFNASDYFILGSHYEGSGYALCDAMACGCVPIVTNIPSFRKMTGEGSSAILFNPGDAEDLVKKLMGLHPEDRPQLQEMVLNQFKKELSFEAIGNQLKEIILQLAGKQPADH